MARTMTAATIAWSVAILAAVAGVLLPTDQQRLSLGLFAFAVVLGLMVAIVLIADALRQRGARRRAVAAAAESPLGRLEYLPPVTTRTRLIHWRGGRYQVTGRRARVSVSAAAETLTLLGSAQPLPNRTDELTESAYPRPASSTRQPQIDAVEASPRAS